MDKHAIIWVIPNLQVLNHDEDIAAGRLVQVLPGWEFRTTPMYLIYAQDCRPTAKLRSIIDFCLNASGRPGPVL